MPAKRRIVFVPFSQNDGGDWRLLMTPSGIEQGGGLNWDAEKYTYIWVDDLKKAKAPFAFDDDTSDTQIYVVGHGGDTILHVENGAADRASQVSPDVLVGFLKAGGLPKKFAGSIKFYNCESAMDGATDQTSFACKCASLFVAQGYDKARFYGYSRSVTTGYESYLNPKTMQSEGKHKIAIKQVNIGNGQILTSHLGRASDFRNEISVKKKHIFSSDYVAVIKTK